MKPIRFVILLLSAALAACSAERFETVGRLDVSVRNACYPSNRAPLQPQYFIKLPVGAVRPAGWVARQLQLQAEGLNGHLDEISVWLEKERNAWLGRGDSNGWEEVPYWLRGYAATAWILGDRAMTEKARGWIEGILSTQRPDGWFDPSSRTSGAAATCWRTWWSAGSCRTTTTIRAMSASSRF